MPKFVRRIGVADLPYNEYYNDVKWCSGRSFSKLGSSFQCTDWAFLRTQEIAECRCTYFTSYGEDKSICDNPMFNRSGKPNAKEWLNATLWDITNNPNEVKLGDIVVYGATWGGGYGHVRIVEAIEDDYFICSGGNENNKGSVKCDIRIPKDQNGILGFIHNPYIDNQEKPIDYKKLYLEAQAKLDKIKGIL